MDKIDQILDKLERMDETIESTQESVNKIAIRQKRMENKVIGDKEFKTPGMIDELSDVKKELSEVKSKIDKKEVSEKLSKAKKTGLVLGASIGGGAGGYGIIEFFKSLFSS